MTMIKNQWVKRSLQALLILLLLGLSISSILSYYLQGSALKTSVNIHPATLTNPHFSNTTSINGQQVNMLRVMSLNLAHGRKNSSHQILLDKQQIQKNLTDISTVLKRVQPDIVALQEADDSSFWSGRFNHVQFLAQKSGYGYIQGIHVDNLDLQYGTGILSLYPITAPLAVTFSPSPPSTPKGFSLATIQWQLNATQSIMVDVVSLHLDFLNPWVRQRQVKVLINTLKDRHKPIIIMGDFNCDWLQSNSALRTVVDNLKLKVYQPESKKLATFRLTQKRLDWIAISEVFSFHSYKILPDVISDHVSTVAELTYNHH